MSKTHFLRSGPIPLLIFCIALLFPDVSRAQTTCATATSISDSYGASSFSASDTVRWYSFTATRADGEIQLYATSSPSYTSMKLYSGSCMSLVLRDVSRAETFGQVIDYSSLTVSSTYFIKLTKSGTSTVSYDLGFAPSIFQSLTCTTCNNLSCDLVCNPSFENCSANPINTGYINNVRCWSTAAGSTPATPDQFNTSGNFMVDVPNNCVGYEPARTGNSYVGIITYSTLVDANVCEWHEYVTGNLSTTLTAGKSYRVSFWVSLGDYSAYQGGKIGAYLSATPPSQPCYGTMPVTPQVVHPFVVTQDNGWTQITGTFIAAGGESYITIGSFVSYANSSVASRVPDSVTTQSQVAYYFIDDVSLREEPQITVTPSPSGLPCFGTPTTFTASASGGTVTSYSWTAPGGSVTCLNPPLCSQVSSANTYTTNATYTITCTLPSGCTSTATYQYYQAAGPSTLSAGPDQNICLGHSAVLTATVTGSYNSSSWEVLNGSTLCTGCTSTTVTPTTTTSYVYTASATGTGCTRKDTITVTVTPLPVTIVSPPGATTCAGCFNFTTSPSYPSYFWSTNAVSSTGGSTSTLNACWGAPFDTSGLNGNVSVGVTDAQGCIGSTYIVIPSCCPFKDGQESVYPNLVNDSTTRVDNNTYPTLFWYNTVNQYYEAANKQFSINGVFIVDRNTRFKGCEIKMGPNAKILIRPGVKLEFTDSSTYKTKIYACSDMWDGIYVDGTNAATKLTVLNGTVIEDAKNAVVSTNGGSFFIDGGTSTCKFNKNNIGVLVKTYSGAHPGVIRKTIFACDAPGQPGATSGVTFAGANCRAPVSGKALAGVYIENCTNVIVGDSASNAHRNLFERTKFGIYATGSNVKVWNNDFKYFTTGSIGKNVPPDGVAIYAKAAKFVPKTATVGRQGNYKAKNKFVKCSYGVYMESYMNLNCEFNRFDSCMNAGITTMNCQNNTILINKDTLQECTGTNIQCVQSTSSNITITYNQINNTMNFTLMNFGNTGIYVAQSAITPVNLIIQNNAVRKMRNGIWVSRVDKCKITDNTANFQTGQPMSQLSPCIGIKLEEVTNSLIRANGIQIATTPTAAVHDEIFGIHVTNCKNDTITKNLLSRMGTGIFLKGSDNPCILACNTLSNCWYGINFNYLNGYGVGVSINDQITWTAANTPYSTGNTWSTVGGGEDITGRILPPTPSGIKWYYNGYNPDVSSVIPGGISGNAATYTANGDRCSFMLAPPAQTAAAIRDYTLGGICKTPRTYDTLNAQFQYHDKVFAYRMLRQNPTWTSLGTGEDTYYSSFYSTESSTNIGKFADVEDSIAVNKITGAATLLATITPSGQYEVNRKALLEVYLGSWAIDSMNLDSAQQAVLTGIINQGMLNGGTSVFDARNMLMLEVHDSIAVRMQQPASTPYTAPAISAAYPNPSNGSVSIKMELGEEQNGSFDIFDLTGRLVGSWQFVGGQETYTFDVSYLPSGTYIYCVQSKGEMLKSDRLVIIRE